MRGAEFAEMSIFAAIAEHKSFAKAAAQLGVSPSTLSHSLRSLEERLGVRLLNRTTRSVSPTDIGKRMLARLRPALDEIEATVESLKAFRDKPAGHLRIIMPQLAAGLVIAPVLARFIAAYPQIVLEISTSPSLTNIVGGDFDAGIRRGERVERDMIAVRVSGPVRMAVVAAPAYLARHRAPATPRDLRTHNCIRFRMPDGTIFPWQFAERGEPFEVAVSGSVIVNDRDLMLRAALDGAGVAYMAADLIEPFTADGRLVAFLEEWTPPWSGLFLYYPSRRQLPMPLQVLVDFLRADLARREQRSREHGRAKRRAARSAVTAAAGAG
jgi:DNA-binding transcriptional LysR family regulator